ncbi:MAG TPA: hypothetical protein EYH56_03295 [Nanoarchaeota archaeon]|nr:hypothetical protein [Nanoarchaeota archaeon]
MEIEKVVEEIISSAKVEAERIVKEGEKEAEKILSEAKKKAETIKQQKLEQVKKLVEEMKKREKALAKLKEREMIMEKKKELIEEILNEIREKFFNLQGKQREKIIQALAEKAGKDWKKVYVSKKDVALVKSIFKNSQVKESDLFGGFIVENEDGSIRIDMSFEAVFEMLKKEIVKGIAEMGENI